MKNLTASQAAKLLGVSADKLPELVEQNILHPVQSSKKKTLYSTSEVKRIKSQRSPTLSEEAAQVGIQLEREVANSVSSLQKLKKRMSILSLLTSLLFAFSAATIAILFNTFPTETSDFFGYYYRYNTIDPPDSRVLAATTDIAKAPAKTPVLADVVKPVAATSLILVKAVDNQKYEQIVTNPVLSASLLGPSGNPGLPGPPGPPGQSGLDGASVTEVITTAGDLITRDADNVTTRLGIGSDGQVLTVSDGVASWEGVSISGITNDQLASPSLTLAVGDGLTGGGLVSLGESINLDIQLASLSGLELLDSGLALTQDCADGEILKWTDGGGWACAADSAGADLQHAASYDTGEATINITASQTVLGTVSVTPQTATGDIYVTGQAEVISSSFADQPFTLVIETTSDCTGSTVGNASVTYTITSTPTTNNLQGVLVVSGVDLNPGTSSQSYSLCASTSAGDTDVQNWRLEGLVID